MHVVALLAAVLFFIACIEASTRFSFARLSRVESRIKTEHAAVLKLSRTPSLKSVLLVGDSLLLEDVNMNLLARTLPSSLHLQRFPIEQTSYLDWLYGLRRIFSEGVRPSTVILCLNPNSFIASGILGDYSAYYLFQASEIPAVAKRARYELTPESSLFFAHYSLFYAGRAALRNFMLNRVYPAYGVLLHNLLTRPAPPVSRDEVLRICEARFQELQRLCASQSAHFIYLMPPGFGIREDAIVEAASRAQTSLLVPVHTNAWPLDKFRDGFHLNEAGAREFTQIFSPTLAALLRSFEETGHEIGAARP